MKKILTILLLLPQITFTQEYQALHPDNWVYDVEVVVFGRQLAQPDALNINSKTSNLDVPIHELLMDHDGLPLTEALPQEDPDESGQWQVPVEGEMPDQQALVWVLMQKDMNHPVVNRLQSNPTIKPLIFQKWRQPATQFLSPEYVTVTSIIKPQVFFENEPSYAEDNPFETQLEVIHEDYAFDGVVAYSKQKFDHVTVKMNYFRHDPFGELVSYTIDQKQRIKMSKWQYFDHQQFGVMVKVSPIIIEATQENGD